ncbi:MAG: hypothetical protein V1779_04545 [bacterium]
MKYLIMLLSVLVISCTVSQFTMYKPSNNAKGWKIECQKDAHGNYNLLIDDITVLSGDFPLFKNNFELGTLYDGHKIQLFGFRRGVPGSGDDWIYEVQIRFIVDESEVTKFVF